MCIKKVLFLKNIFRFKNKKYSNRTALKTEHNINSIVAIFKENLENKKLLSVERCENRISFLFEGGKRIFIRNESLTYAS
jgi:hypothetical protein